MNSTLTDLAPSTEVDLKRAAWLAERKNGIGSSDAAAALGLDPYKSELKLCLEKRGEIQPDDLSDNEAVHFGTILEETIAQEFSRRTGLRVKRVPEMLISKTHPFMRATLDRRIVGKREVLECKTVGFWAAQRKEDWGEPPVWNSGKSASDVVPPRYFIQAMHQIAVGNFERCHIAALIAGQEFRIYTIERDEKIIAAMISQEAEFWRRVVEGDLPAPRSTDDTALLYPLAAEIRVQATQEIAMRVGDMEDLQRQRKELDEQIDTIKTEIQAFMGEADTLALDNEPIAYWKNRASTSLDTKRMKAEAPDLYERYARRGMTRAFTLPKESK